MEKGNFFVICESRNSLLLWKNESIPGRYVHWYMNVCMQQQNSRPRGCLNVRVADSFLVNHCCCTWRACCAFMFLLFTPWKQKAAHKVKLPLEIKADICTKTHKIVKVRVQWLRAVVMIIHPIRKCHLSDRWFFLKTPTQVIQTRALHSLCFIRYF